MYLTRLEVSNLRIIETAALAPASSVNLLVGANGSGKTSLLEAIHLLCTGRSFRSRRAQEFIRRGASKAWVHARIVGEDGEDVSAGVEKGPRSTRIRWGGSEVRSASALARRLPLVVIPPDSQQLVFDGANLRRRLMDWGLFHVEHEYGAVYQRYRRALQQRNSQLRIAPGPSALAPWNDALSRIGEKLHRLRHSHLQQILPRISTLTTDLSGLKVSVHYKPGWDDAVPLSDALAAATGRDTARGYTGIGPHRADLELLVSGNPAHQVLSRGEAKLVCFALWLAQVKDHQLEIGRAPVVLIDDLGAELDATNRRRVFATLLGLRVQSFVTSVNDQLAQEVDGPWKGFHVERGRVEEMV
jgi:DNA replication and repair protein RecF